MSSPNPEQVFEAQDIRALEEYEGPRPGAPERGHEGPVVGELAPRENVRHTTLMTKDYQIRNGSWVDLNAMGTLWTEDFDHAADGRRVLAFPVSRREAEILASLSYPTLTCQFEETA